MTSSIAVPARPKPGRKAATDEPQSKRKYQNREAQRAFRDRKQQHTEALEKQNQEFQAEIDALKNERFSLRAELDRFRNSLQLLQDQSALSQRREIEALEKWKSTLDQLTAFQKRYQDVEVKAGQLESEVQLQRTNARAPNPIYHAPPNQPVITVSHTTDQNLVGPSNALLQGQMPLRPTSTASRVPQKRQFTTDGCGDCEENGPCPCVDSYVEDAAQPASRDLASETSRHPSNASMSIDALLAPSIQRSSSYGDVPELINDQSSPEELETDFTRMVHPLHTTSAEVKLDPCGFCAGGDVDCLCAHSTASNTSIPLMSANNPPMGPPQTNIKPGTCMQCQQNPEQKAYCESLALERQTNREQAEGQPDSKRSRLDRPTVAVPCASAFALYKQYSRNDEPPSYDDVYKTYINSNPNSRRPTGVFTSGMERTRQLSAFETDIATVIANLHRGSSSFGPFGESSIGVGKTSSTKESSASRAK